MTRGSHRDQATALRQMMRDSKTCPGDSVEGARYIAVSGGKGGVGKSSVSLNLAISLADIGGEVVLVDTDFGLPNLDILVGCAPEWTMADVMRELCEAEAALHPIAGGVNLLAGGDLWTQRPPDYSQVRRFLQSIARQLAEVDYMIVDTQAGVGPAVTGMLAAAEMVLMVVLPEPTSVMDAYRTVKQVSSLEGCRRIGVLINRSDERTARQTFSAMDNMMKRYLSTEAQFIGWVPYDPSVGEAVRRQTPLVKLHPHSGAGFSQSPGWLPANPGVEGCIAMTDGADIELQVNDSVLLSAVEDPDDERMRYSTYIQQLGDNWLSVAVPTRRGRPVRFTRGQPVEVVVLREDALYAAVSKVVEVSWRQKTPFIRIQRPAALKRVQRRAHYRWECSRAVRWQRYGEESDEDHDDIAGGWGTTVDISAGGLKMMVSRRLQVGAEYGLRLDLQDSKVQVVGEVLRMEGRVEKGYIFAVEFTEIAARERDKITRYVFEQQMKMRRKGLI